MLPNETETVQIVVNGEDRRIEPKLTVEQLLLSMNLALDRLAVEMNGRILRRPAWGETVIEPGFQFEIVQFVGGG